MKALKKIANYSLWSALSILSGILYMRILLGPRAKLSNNFLDVFFNLLYDFALVHIGFRMGIVIALIFISIDIFYTSKRFKNNITAIRFLILFTITTLIATTHYLLEKVIDII